MEIHYQPLVSLADRRIVGAEALVRWNHPDHGMLLPGPVHPAGRGQRHHPRASAARSSSRPAGRPRRGSRSSGHAPDRREPVGPSVPAGRPGRRHRRRAASPPVSTPSQLCLEITESLAMDDVDADHDRPHPAAHARRPPGHRRLRDRALLARLPGPLPHRRREDRPELRPRHRAGPGEVGHRLGRRGPLAGHRLDHGGRGGRDAGPARGAQEPGLRHRPGLLLRPPRLRQCLRPTSHGEHQPVQVASGLPDAAPRAAG